MRMRMLSAPTFTAASGFLTWMSIDLQTWLASASARPLDASASAVQGNISIII